MPCLHKFYDDLTLEHLDYAPETLIIGTFNPEWPKENHAEWFYGRTHDIYGNLSNNFWEVLPRIYNETSLIDAGPIEWKNFCRRNAIAITDLIAEITDADQENQDHNVALGKYGDKELCTLFEKHVLVSITRILDDHPTIKNIYLTRGANGFWKTCWEPIQAAARNKSKNIQTLITPSDWSRIQYFKYNKRHPNQRVLNLADYIIIRWLAVWHF